MMIDPWIQSLKTHRIFTEDLSIKENEMAELPKMNVNIHVESDSISPMQHFIAQALTTESRDIHAIAANLTTQRDLRILHAAMGLVTEAAEVMDAVKKSVFYSKVMDATNLKEEAGDILWYMAILLDEMGWSFEEVCELVLAKLRIRYPSRFTLDKATNRNLTAERNLLERFDSSAIRSFEAFELSFGLQTATGAELDKLSEILGHSDSEELKRKDGETDDQYRYRLILLGGLNK